MSMNPGTKQWAKLASLLDETTEGKVMTAFRKEIAAHHTIITEAVKSYIRSEQFKKDVERVIDEDFVSEILFDSDDLYKLAKKAITEKIKKAL